MDARIIISLMFLCTSCAVIKEEPVYTDELKYAVSYCLSKAYSDSVFSKDAAYVSGAYLQKGKYGLNVYESIREFVDLYRQEAYNSKHNRNLAVMQCVDLSTSSELRMQLRKMINGSAT
ncbi:T6SS amidase immunity protein Tai4 family protein [Thalassomonas sp. RHCl1]|uniref:T6SS amidase immunity protein Tai4 family protein n=1 Tax=Thalassomonas sp. RHCl1 TaxID=2995320 RepID=UPI00248C5843|nr:T6SS amidase immunity protein Tai4 family protein [Thalassomonas sp. RHCl1]